MVQRNHSRHKADLVRPGRRAGAITRGSGAGRQPLRSRVSSAEGRGLQCGILKHSWSHHPTSHICLCSDCNTKSLAAGTNLSSGWTHDHHGQSTWSLLLTTTLPSPLSLCLAISLHTGPCPSPSCKTWLDALLPHPPCCLRRLAEPRPIPGMPGRPCLDHCLGAPNGGHTHHERDFSSSNLPVQCLVSMLLVALHSGRQGPRPGHLEARAPAMIPRSGPAIFNGAIGGQRHIHMGVSHETA